MKIKKLVLVILILIWLCVIFSFSAQDSEKSLATSDQLIIKVAEVIKKRELTAMEKIQIVDKYVLIVRKGAHFISYFILGILLYLILKEIFGIKAKTLILTIIFCMLYACTDEFHQYFIDGRSASIIDVGIDTSGAFISSSLLFFIQNLKKKRKGIINK